MKNLRTIVVLVGLGASAVAQGPKKTDPGKPKLSLICQDGPQSTPGNPRLQWDGESDGAGRGCP
jgi:hypothetical protein